MERVCTPHVLKSHLILPYSIGYCSKDNPPEKCASCPWNPHLFVKVIFPNHSQCFHVDCFFKQMTRGTNQLSIDLVQGLGELEPQDLEHFLSKMKEYQSDLAEFQFKSAAGYFGLAHRPAPDEKEDSISERTVLDLAECSVRSAQELIAEQSIETCTFCNNFITSDDDIVVKFEEKCAHFECSLKNAGRTVGRVDSLEGWVRLGEHRRNIARANIAAHIETLIGSVEASHLTFLHSPTTRYLIFSTAHVLVWSSKVNVICNSCFDTIHRHQVVFHVERLQFAHSQCVLRQHKVCFDTPEDVPGFQRLPEDAQRHLMLVFRVALRNGQLKAMTLPRGIEAKERRGRMKNVRIGEEKTAQLSAMCSLRNKFQKRPKKTLQSILIEHNQDVPGNYNKMLNRLVDIATFGIPLPCPLCLGKIAYDSEKCTYLCDGQFSPYSKCRFEVKNPERAPIDGKSILELLQLEELTGQKERLYVDSDENLNPRGKSHYIFPAELTELDVPQAKKNRAVNTPTRRTLYHIKNGTAVPSISEHSQSTHIMRDSDDGALFEAFLTSVEVRDNRNTSVHLMILEEDHFEQYYLLKIVARLGTLLFVRTERDFYDKEEAIGAFWEEFYDFTGNCWPYREKFQKKAGKCQWVENWTDEPQSHSYSSVEQEMLREQRNAEDDEEFGGWELNHQQIASVHQMVGGRISHKNRQFLESILEMLKVKILKHEATEMDFIDATNMVYSFLPTNVGFSNHSSIRGISDIQDVLQSIRISSPVDLYDEIIPQGIDLAIAWKTYAYLEHLKRSSRDWEVIEKYLKNTKGVTHNHVVANVELIDIMKIKREKKYCEYPGGRILLWHGTKKENLSSILDQGLLKEPAPNVKRTGSMFGKGVYFADCFSKSYNYARNYGDGDVYMFLCEVCTGSIFHSFQPISEDSVRRELATGKFDSIRGNGRYIPDPDDVTELNEAQVPYGKLKQITVPGIQLNYNEYIVYDESRVTLRYLVRVKCLGK